MLAQQLHVGRLSVRDWEIQAMASQLACRKGSTKVSCLMRDEKLNAPFHGLAALSQAPDNVPCKDQVKVAVLIALWEPGCGIASSFFPRSSTLSACLLQSNVA